MARKAKQAETTKSAAATTAAKHVEPASVGRYLWEWTKTIAGAAVLFLVFRTFVLEAFQIPTGSMENTLLVGDFLLVNKMAYGAEIPGTSVRFPALDPPEVGDVVVFEPPPAAGQAARTNYVKRLVVRSDWFFGHRGQ